MHTRAAVALVAVVLLAGGAAVAIDAALFSETSSVGLPTQTPEATDSTPTATATPSDGYERTTVAIVDEDGTTLATVRVRIADTFAKRYTGLSDAESLDYGEGMLFVHDEEGEHAYVMRRMDFSLDIVFADASGTITTIHHAPVENDDSLTRYRGRGRYVLEVPMGYTNETGVEVGDRLVIADE